MSERGLLDASAALMIALPAGRGDDVEGAHRRSRLVQLPGGSGLEAEESLHHDDLNAVPELYWLPSRQFLNTGLDRPGTMFRSREGSGALADRGQFDDDDNARCSGESGATRARPHRRDEWDR